MRIENDKGHSIFTFLDARLNLIILPLMLINVLMLDPDRPFHSVCTLLLIFITTLTGSYRTGKLIKKILLFYPMILLFSFPLLMTNPASENIQPIYKIGHFNLYISGLTEFLIVQLKYIFSLLFLFSYTAGVRSRDVFRALRFFRVADWILAVLQYIAQLIRVLAMEFGRIRIAYQSRAVRPRLVLKIKTMLGLVYVLTIRIIERSEKIFLAMLSRGFKGKFYLNGSLTWKVTDTFAFSLLLLFTLWPFIQEKLFL
jgi:cobalt/nickel transport system permease protein